MVIYARRDLRWRGEERWVQIEIANEDSYNWGIVTRARSSSSATPFKAKLRYDVA